MSNKKNMVDERFELCAVLFRLAGHPIYNRRETDYHKELDATFARFENHEAVEYTKTLPLGYGSVFRFSLHIEKKDNHFVFIEDISSLLNRHSQWDEETSKGFLEQLNKFYIDTNYAEFYNSHLELFEQATKKFIDECYGKIDFEWFRKYIDLSKLGCIYSLSTGNFGMLFHDKIWYCLVYSDGWAIIHEYCHQFANPLAEKWYAEKPEFKKLCDDSFDKVPSAYQDDGVLVGCEYVTRAYNALYFEGRECTIIENGKTLELSKEFFLSAEVEQGFIYIQEVYDMILELEK